MPTSNNVLLKILIRLLSIADNIAQYLFGASHFHIHFGTPTEQSGTTAMTITAPQMTATQKNTITLAPTNRLGKPAKIDGSIDFNVPDESLLVVTPSETNPLEFTFAGQGIPDAAASILFTADADLGEGIVPIELTVVVPIGDAPAEGFGASFGTPTEIE